MNQFRKPMITIRILNDQLASSLDQFHGLFDKPHGIFNVSENANVHDKVELLFGKLVPMSPVGIAHGKVVKKMNRLFINRFPEASYTIGVKAPITLIDASAPEQDLFVAKGKLES